MVLELADIQGTILRGYSFGRAIHLFVAFPDAQAGRRWLSAIAAQVQTAETWQERPDTAVNVALTYAGLRLLGAADEDLPDALREPMAERAEATLGDDLGTWRGGLGDGRAHALLLLAGDGFAFAAKLKALRALGDEHGLQTVFEQRRRCCPTSASTSASRTASASRRSRGTESRRAGQGEPDEYGSWRDLKAGEFVHGYPDEDGQTEDAALLRNGTFMVYRKLEQDVERFSRYLDQEADHYCAAVGVNHGTSAATAHAYARELIAAKLVGRWRDGVAVELAPERDPDEAHALRHASVGEPDNDFRYGDDADGRRCPVGAHVRRANPRDSARLTAQARRHRIIRRGIPYEEGDARGLIFICFNASFERQFETVQRRWCDDGNAFGLGRDQDVLFATGAGSGKLTIPGDPPHFARAERGLVTTRGCEYLLMPGLRALRALAQGG